MSRFVVDASVVVQLLVTEQYTTETKALFATIEDGNKLVVPEFGLIECANVLWKHVRLHHKSLVDNASTFRFQIGMTDLSSSKSWEDLLLRPTLLRI